MTKGVNGVVTDDRAYRLEHAGKYRAGGGSHRGGVGDRAPLSQALRRAGGAVDVQAGHLARDRPAALEPSEARPGEPRPRGARWRPLHGPRSLRSARDRRRPIEDVAAILETS